MHTKSVHTKSVHTKSVHTARLVELISLLSEGPPQTVDALAETFEIAPRTVNRNLKTLSGAGFEIDRDAAGGVSIRSASFLRPLDLTVDEAIAVLSIAGSLGDRQGLPGYRLLSVVADKVLQSLPASIRSYFELAVSRADVNLACASQPERTSVVYQTVRDAVAQQRTLHMRYESIWDGQAIDLDLDPYFLKFHRRTWYCIGWSHWHKEVRTFHLGRVRHPVATGETFSADEITAPEDYFGNAWDMIRGDDAHEVRIRFRPKVARNVADVRWHRTQRFDWQEDGSVVMSVSVDGIDEISWWVLGYGREAEVLEPAALKENVLAHAREMVATYEDLG